MSCLVSINHPSTILISSRVPSANHFFIKRMYLWRTCCFSVRLVEKGRARMYMARSIALTQRLALLSMSKNEPIILSTYESSAPWWGRGRSTSAGRTGATGICGGRYFWGGIDAGAGINANVNVGFYRGLLVISFARSVRISIMIHHLDGLKDPPNVKQRYIRAQIVVVHIHFAADLVLK